MEVKERSIWLFLEGVGCVIGNTSGANNEIVGLEFRNSVLNTSGFIWWSMGWK